MVFDRFVKSLRGKGRAAAAAKKAELRGELSKAVELYADADEPGEAARVMLLRGDAESDPRARLQHYTQAAAAAPQGTDAQRQARLKRAELVIAMAGDAAVSAVARRDVLAAAGELEALGEEEKAARAYATVGDTEGEARALASAGDVERLEDLLSVQQAKDRELRKRQDLHADIELLATSGRRREALATAEEHARARGDDSSLRERAQQLRGRRAEGPLARITVRDRPFAIALGDEIVIGRTEGALRVPSNAVSRRHVRIARGAPAGGAVRTGALVDADSPLGDATKAIDATDAAAAGAAGVSRVAEPRAIFVEDLGSRNGTQLHGMAIAGKMPLGAGLELKIGKEVALRVTPSTDLEGAIAIEVAGNVWLAPLGAAKLGIGDWRIEVASDGWIELIATAPAAFLRDVALMERTTLLTGDAISEARGGPVVLRILGA